MMIDRDDALLALMEIEDVVFGLKDGQPTFEKVYESLMTRVFDIKGYVLNSENKIVKAVT